MRRFGSVRFRGGEAQLYPALSADGQLLATAGTRAITVWDLDTGRAIHTIRADIAVGVSPLAFSPDRKQLAYLAAADVGIRVVDLASGQIVAAFGPARQKVIPYVSPDPSVRHEEFYGVCFLPGGRELRAFGNDRVVTWDVATGRQLRAFELPGAGYDMTPDGSRVIAHSPGGSGEKTGIALFDGDGKRLARVPVEVETGTTVAALSPGGKHFAAVLRRVETRVWDDTGKERALFPHGGNDLTLSSDGSALAVSTGRGEILRHDLTTDKALPTLHGEWTWTTALRFRTGRQLIATARDGTIRRFDWAAGKELPLQVGYAAPTRVALSPDGRTLAIGDAAGRLDLFDPATGNLQKSLQPPRKFVTKLAFSPDGRQLAVGDAFDEVTVFDPINGTVLRELRLEAARPALIRPGVAVLQPASRLQAPEGRVNSLAFTPDGRLLIVCGNLTGTYAATTNGAIRWHLTEVRDLVSDVSPSGDTLVTSHSWNHIAFRSPATGEPTFILEIVPTNVRMRVEQPLIATMLSARFSPDGALLATGHQDAVVRFWDFNSRTEKRQLKGHEAAVRAFEFSPDGKWLLTGGDDFSLRVWETVTGQEVLRLEGAAGPILDIAVAPDGKTAITGGDATATVWSLRPRELPAWDAEALWRDLGSLESAVAYRAVWALAARPTEAIPLLRAKIAPAPVVDAQKIAGLIADLENPSFKTREAATRALAELDAQAASAMRTALAKAPRAEARQRLEKLIAGLVRDPTPEEIRAGRAVKAMELAGTAEARALLASWAGGAPGMRLTEDAKAALRRLVAAK